MAIVDKKLFINGGLNSDDDNRAMPPEDYRYALNIRNGSSDASNMGAVEGALGNELVSVTLPAGNNECVGSVEDRENQKVYYFIANDAGSHSIYEYDVITNSVELVMQDEVLNFNKFFPVHSADVIEGLLQWTDNRNEPRSINIEKAKKDKRFKYKFVFGLPGDDLIMSVGTDYSVEILDEVGGTVLAPYVFHTASDPNIVDDLEEAAKVIADAINNDITTSAELTATACGQYVEVEVDTAGYFEVIFTASTHDVLAIPQNFYYNGITEEQINSVKDPQHCEPQTSVVQDVDRESNRIRKHVFQFRTRLIFTDSEKSALGPISDIALDYNDCSGSSLGSANNCIVVNFTDTRLNDLTSLSVITGLEIFVRDHEEGKWRSVTVLDQHQFGIGTNSFKFYNDGIYSGIADEDADKLFDSHPILAEAQAIIKNRKHFGNTLEGYDPVCVDADIDIDYEESPDVIGHSITGKIFIRNAFVGQTEYKLHQPIWDNSSNDIQGTTVFGGFGPLDVVNGVGQDYDQILPLDGFVVYLAGTDFYDISKQAPNDNPNPQNPNGVYIGTNGNIRDDITGNGNSGETPETRAYSTFSIDGVPDGTYILRVASHKTTQDDLNDPGRRYQRSSTYVDDIGGGGQELLVTISGGNVDIGKIQIQDLTDPSLSTQSTAISGYVTDKDVTLPGSPTAEDYRSDTRVELANVELDIGVLFHSAKGHTTTDHNGFFWWGAPYTITGVAPNIDVDDVFTMDLSHSPTVVNENGDPFSAFDGAQHQEVVCRNTNNDVSINGRTKVEGSTGFPGVVVLSDHGRWILTDSVGDYSIIQYGDTLIYNASGQKRRYDSIRFFQRTVQCLVEFTPDSQLNNIFIGPSDFNFNNPFLLQPVVGTVIYSAIDPAWARGADWQFGIVYYDHANRSNAVNTSDRLIKHSTFYTEINPDTGLQDPDGKAILSWEVKHQPPDWATHWQWVRTKNTFAKSYLQWVADSVDYIDDSGASVSFANSTKCKINISNIGEYLTRFPNSIVSFTAEPGDRIRFIRDEDGDLYSTYEDVEIIDVQGDDLIIYTDFSLGELQDGVMFEVYKPELDVEVKTYYEFGECYEVGNPGESDRYHKGPTQDQNPADLSGTPATGTFSVGDAYYRVRSVPSDGGEKVRYGHNQFISDFYESFDESVGRVNAENPDFKQIRRTEVDRFSGKIFPETKINNLNRFDFNDQKPLPKEHGPIQKLQRVENVLLAICQFRVNALYIEESIITNNEGVDTITTSQDVIGGVRALKGKFGTLHPESVDEWEGEVRWFDVSTGKVLRYANNGLTPISELKMGNFFSDKAKEYGQILSPEIATVVSTYDPFFEEYVLSFKFHEAILTGNDITPVTLAFSEKIKRWTTFYSFEPEELQRAGQNIISFKTGNLYLHNQNTNRANYYGSQDDVEIKIVGNIDPFSVKVFKGITVDSPVLWWCPEIQIPINANLSVPMNSRLKPAHFRNKEGKWYASFLRDENTPGPGVHKLLNGRALRGETVEVLLRANEIDKDIVLMSVDLLSVKSEYSNRQA